MSAIFVSLATCLAGVTSADWPPAEMTDPALNVPALASLLTFQMHFPTDGERWASNRLPTSPLIRRYFQAPAPTCRRHTFRSTSKCRASPIRPIPRIKRERAVKSLKINSTLNRRSSLLTAIRRRMEIGGTSWTVSTPKCGRRLSPTDFHWQIPFD